MTLGTPDTAAIGTWVKIASPVSVEIIAGAGFDFVVLDLEHGVVPLPWVHEACAIAQARGLAVLVRLPNASGQEVSRVLDMGADGILVPQLRSAEQTQRAVGAALFPPRVRYTGASMTFNIAGILGAAPVPAVAQYLAERGGLSYVGYYLSAATIVSLAALWWTRHHDGRHA